MFFAGLDLYCCADPAQPFTTADEELDDLGHDLVHDLLDLDRDVYEV